MIQMLLFFFLSYGYLEYGTLMVLHNLERAVWNVATFHTLIEIHLDVSEYMNCKKCGRNDRCIYHVLIFTGNTFRDGCGRDIWMIIVV